MTKRTLAALSALALLGASTLSSRADQFSRIENSPATYWVPDPTPGPAGYPQQPAPYYYGYGPGPYGPPPGYYGPPPPPPGPPVVVVPHFFIGFHFH
jgi:hypothetical protein